MISAHVVLDSVSRHGHRLTTIAMEYPRFIHSELMTHRAFSRNAASSRAIPIEKLLDRVRNDPAMPVRWGLNGKGMQDHGEMSVFGQRRAKETWLRARDDAVRRAEDFLALAEVPHKQIVNRILEPYVWMTTLVSSTSWDNFFALRDHKDADPTFAALAAVVRDAYRRSVPQPLAADTWHLPYIEEQDVDPIIKHAISARSSGLITATAAEAAYNEVALAVSTARCSRVSYLNHENKRPSIDEDLAQYLRLVGSQPVHASPAEHQGLPDEISPVTQQWCQPHYHGNFTGWIQHRKLIPGEAVSQSLYAGELASG